MKLASLCGEGWSDNNIFDLGNPANRDNCFAPFALLRQEFAKHGIELNTADKNAGRAVAFEIHQDTQRPGAIPAYLILFETPLIRPDNGNPALWEKYRKIFTWNPSLIDGRRFIGLFYPNPIAVPAVDGWSRRDRFCCMISGNKAAAVEDARELYSERARAIRWFEKHAPQDFDLYGIGWDAPQARRSLINKIVRRLWRYIPRSWLWARPFPSYRGRVNHKREVLLKTRFCICYENVRDMPGYVTEKIFDAFFAGCVPVYWGPDNVADYIPADCFIDRRKFGGYDELYRFLKAMPESEYRRYQQSIAAYLQSAQARPFSAEAFAETVAGTIVNDIASDLAAAV